MKVYVSEMPKDCEKCPFNRMTFFWTSNVFEKCKATNECQLGFNGKCELQSLADYTKQVRKETIAEVRELLEKKVPNGLYLSRAVLKKELDQIQSKDS